MSISNAASGRNDLISVCICTFKRPSLLLNSLNRIVLQKTDGLFAFEIVVIDNDRNRTAANVIEQFRLKTNIEITYKCEQIQNIALARNKAIQKAKGNLIAFIDDDEWPVITWLLKLYNTINKYNADGVLGPVRPHFESKPPSWIIRGKFCDRPSHSTGTILHWDDTRTGNVLIKKSIFTDLKIEFDDKFGRSGGEDIDFFKKAINRGKIFVWCEDAAAYEAVPPDRWKASFYIKKYIRIGGLNGARKRKESVKQKLVLRRTITSILYFSFILISPLFGRHLFINYLCKLAYNVSWFLGYLFNILLLTKK